MEICSRLGLSQRKEKQLSERIYASNVRMEGTATTQVLAQPVSDHTQTRDFANMEYGC